MTISRPVKILLSLLAVLVLLVGITVALVTHYDWNRAKPWLNQRTSEAMGRPFSIDGNLALTWQKTASGTEKYDHGWRRLVPWPHLEAENIHIASPTGFTHAGATAPELASLRRISFSLNPFALFAKKISVPQLIFDTPAVNLLRESETSNNWTFPKKDNTENRWQLDVQQVVFAKGSVHLIDAVKHVDVVADIDTLSPDAETDATNTTNATNTEKAAKADKAAKAAKVPAPAYGIKWTLNGKMNGENLSGGGKAGGVLSLQNQTDPFPLMVDLHAGKTSISAVGTITKPAALAAVDLHLKMSGVSMARLYALTQLVLPETPPYVTEGHLKGALDAASSHWIYDNFTGRVGKSDINGTLDFLSRPGQQARPVLSGKIVSHALHFDDLSPVIGADSNASKAERGAESNDKPSGKVLPTEHFKTERWTSIDADVKFKAEKIIRIEALPIDKLDANVQLKNGVMTLKPLDFDIAGGRLNSNIVLDGSGKTEKNAIKATMKISAQHLKINQLFPTMPTLQASIGEINGEANLSAVGNSIASLLAASNGEVKTLIDHGTISKLLLEEMGLNVGNIVLSRLFGDKQVKLNCMATDFGVTNGVMQSRIFIVDTDEAILNISGDIDLAQEQLDLTIHPNTKGLRIFSLRSPLYVRGTFKHPDVSIDKGVLAAKAGGAIVLAAVAPLAALLPLVNTGPNQDSACGKRLAEARAKPIAPPPGKPNAKPLAR